MLRNLFEKQRLLLVSGILFAVLFCIFAIIASFDDTQLLGINRWIKPMKFANSIAIFLATLAVLFYFIDGRERTKRNLAIGIVGLLIGEMVLITMQAARGISSHFNISTAFDGFVFSTMGVMIAINTVLVAYVLVLYFRATIKLSPALIWGIRLGLILMLAASFEGGYMSAHLSHAVGVADGGPGLPFVNWSTTGGDLRIAHFIGLHALQAIPLFAVVSERLAASRATVLTTIFAALYFAAFTATFVNAMLGRPLV